MGIAVFGVALLILLFLGWRESLVVLLAIPSTLALTLMVFYLYGYTLNRITLFALIFSIGILVDDAIVVIENIIRHLRLPGAENRPLTEVALAAVDEVGNPTILATWAVIAAILPMAFVGGLMGPYMRPIPIGATAAMLFSLVIAFTVTPWAAIRVLRQKTHRRDATNEAVERPATDAGHAPGDWFTRLYYRAMTPLLDRARWRWVFLVSIVALLLGAVGLVGLGAVKVKMLPFDNKSEFQIILNTPEGSTLEHTLRVAQEMTAAIRHEPEVRDYQIYAGAAAPFNFNGLVRHYFAREGPTVADIQVNLVSKADRDEQSHAIAKRLRPRLAAIAARHGAEVALAEVPPGPPVLQTIVAEIYGPDEPQRLALASEVRAIMARTEGVVDVDWYVRGPQTKLRYTVDREKAAHHGVTVAAVTRTLELAAHGEALGLLHLPHEREDVPLVLELAPAARPTPDALLALHVGDQRVPTRPSVPLSELVRVERASSERDLYRKNLQPVTYVTADVAGAIESPAYALFHLQREIERLDARRFGATTARLPIFHLAMPADSRTPALKWDGEWHITLEVFRDLGLAFAAVMVLIATLMVGWFRSYVTPLVVMAAIPFSLVGILPAHWALGAFFTATSMIGFMAGAGIVVRNSIILVDFIELRRAQGLALRDAVIEAGAVRFRPMLLTALAVVVGASVILADPIFQGLAISLMFGEIASLLISRMAVPVLYFMAHRGGSVA
jgi:multidrug efflux pump subunit AcrB